ncbi:hypothetical protein KIN20_008140 [Parelaphostrongylus tenuis]|uniref:Uncharacterized protein n=1 Tax=Parelaphostrongylus tenuis TaxID=148309 RepID=A0AAD5QHA1_PARTN|nr:hypothetical protein KIN20_008140 [Parelaphostrongylus tenuis]
MSTRLPFNISEDDPDYEMDDHRRMESKRSAPWITEMSFAAHATKNARRAISVCITTMSATFDHMTFTYIVHFMERVAVQCEICRRIRRAHLIFCRQWHQ